MKQLTYTCDGKDCKNVRRLANHWWIGRLYKRGDKTTIELMEWDDERAQDPDANHLCGYQCVNLWQQQQMEAIQENLRGDA
jgi:hypothetical protein